MPTEKPELSKFAPNAVVGFAGGGGVECGLLAAGIRPALSIEFDPNNPDLSQSIADVHDQNFGSYGKLLRMTMEAWAVKDFPDCPDDVDYAHFSPVCSNFSRENYQGDQVSDLTAADAIARFIDTYQPWAITIENVPDYQDSESWNIIAHALTTNDYLLNCQILDLSEYGVPQTRKRFICIATKDYLFPDLCTQRPISWLEAIGGDYKHLAEDKLVKSQTEAVKDLEKGVYLMPRIGYHDAPRPTPSYLPAPTIKKSIFHDQNNNGRAKFWNIWDGKKAYNVNFDCIRKLGTFPDWYQFPNEIAVAGAIVGYSVPPTIIEQIYLVLERIRWSKYEFHPLANLFPLLQDTDKDSFQALARSIRDNGLIQPIVLYEGKILDGRNRYLACLSVGVTPRFVDWQPSEQCEDVLLYVLALNMERRHLSQSQRAAIYLEANAIQVRLAEEQAKERRAATLKQNQDSTVVATLPQRDKSSTEQPAPKTRDTIAQQIGVGARTVQDAKLVQETDPELFQEVKEGKISAPAAAKQIRQKAEESKPKQGQINLSPKSSFEESYFAEAREIEGDRPAIQNDQVTPESDRESVKSDRPRHELDFYETNPKLTEYLLQYLPLKQGDSIFEPCVGHGAIASLLSKKGFAVTSNDLDEAKPADYHFDATVGDNWANFPEVDWIITNPPFGSDAAKIVPLAFEKAKKGIAFLLRITYLEPCGDRAKWMIDHPLDLLIPFNPRPKFRSDTTGSDSATVAWFVWRKFHLRGFTKILFANDWETTECRDLTHVLPHHPDAIDFVVLEKLRQHRELEAL